MHSTSGRRTNTELLWQRQTIFHLIGLTYHAQWKSWLRASLVMRRCCRVAHSWSWMSMLQYLDNWKAKEDDAKHKEEVDKINKRTHEHYQHKADEAKPEVLEDWDPRFVVTTLSCSQEGDVVSLSQVAEKDMFAKQDSVVTLEVEEGDPDTMIMTASAGDVTGP